MFMAKDCGSGEGAGGNPAAAGADAGPHPGAGSCRQGHQDTRGKSLWASPDERKIRAGSLYHSADGNSR